MKYGDFTRDLILNGSEMPYFYFLLERREPVTLLVRADIDVVWRVPSSIRLDVKNCLCIPSELTLD